MNRLAALCLTVALALAAPRPGFAQDEVPGAAAGANGKDAATRTGPVELPPPIYEDKLLRLSEILGSLSFLRDLCGDADGEAWRTQMNALLAAEQPSPKRRTRLVARFNHGFETFNAVYRVCTPSARLAIARYLREGETLASDVRGRYSQ